MRSIFSRAQKSIIVQGILSIVLIIVVLQLWLLTATMDAFLGGEDAVIVPAALASAACFAFNAGLLWFLYRIEIPQS
ncbi:MAG TPA: DUF6755 family protein [Thermoanaerobaculia bacterium]|nr:DUF6755 family protein [Thermoanaerobaculia bacterium]